MAHPNFEEKLAIVTVMSILIAFLYYAAGTSSFYTTSFYASASPTVTPVPDDGMYRSCPFKYTCPDCPVIENVANKEYFDDASWDQRITWSTDLETTDSILYYRMAGSGTFNEIPVIGVQNEYIGLTEYEWILTTSLAPGRYEYNIEATNPIGTFRHSCNSSGSFPTFGLPPVPLVD